MSIFGTSATAAADITDTVAVTILVDVFVSYVTFTTKSLLLSNKPLTLLKNMTPTTAGVTSVKVSAVPPAAGTVLVDM